jgi:hypothetical protein
MMNRQPKIKFLNPGKFNLRLPVLPNQAQYGGISLDFGRKLAAMGEIKIRSIQIRRKSNQPKAGNYFNKIKRAWLKFDFVVAGNLSFCMKFG